jgi:hypothetical protein
MAMRAKHGMMQGVPLEPLLLLTQEEVAEHEAACAVQAITRGRAERGSAGGVREQLQARRVEREARLEQARQIAR